MPLTPDARLRYVVLHHTDIPHPHYDLMFETTPDSPLATWRSPAWPVTTPTSVERLPDHRAAYLTYEGPLTDNRGQVTRVASGTCQFLTQSDTTWHLLLDTDQRLSLTREHAPATTWLLCPI
jgi:hypothetical protein